eukprot:PhF_6_TR30280/c0_g1_i1/m.44433
MSIFAVVFCVSLFLSQPVKSNKVNVNKGYWFEFEKHHRCPACLVLSKTLSEEMERNQLKAGTDKDKKKYILREDRVSDVIEAAAKAAVQDYSWIESEKPRFWLNQALLESNLLDEEWKTALRQYMKQGGDSGFRNYVRGTLLGEAYEEAVEKLVKDHNTNRAYISDKFCREIVKICTKEETLPNSDAHPGGDPEIQEKVTAKKEL